MSAMFEAYSKACSPFTDSVINSCSVTIYITNFVACVVSFFDWHLIQDHRCLADHPRRHWDDPWNCFSLGLSPLNRASCFIQTHPFLRRSYSWCSACSVVCSACTVGVLSKSKVSATTATKTVENPHHRCDVGTCLVQVYLVSPFPPVFEAELGHGCEHLGMVFSFFVLVLQLLKEIVAPSPTQSMLGLFFKQ